MAGKCEECGCVCAKCTKNNETHTDMHLHAEIENLRQRLIERDSHIVKMETQFLNEADKFPNGELASMKEELRIWQEKYSRLYEAHKRVQKVNQNLEDKLLRIVDKCETEKGAFAKDIATLSHRLADANYTIHRLTQDNEKYRNDVNLAIQLLQCKPSNFVGQKYDSLPSEVQAKVRMYVAQKRRSSDVSPPDVKSITVPISTFPPTAMVYNITKANVEKHSDDESDDSKPPVDVVSAAIMAKVLEDRERERIFAKHCNSCTCHRAILMIDSETQASLDRLDVRFCGEGDSIESSSNRDISETLNSKQMDTQGKVETTSNPTTFRHISETKSSRRRTEIGNIDNLTNANTKLSPSFNNSEGHLRLGRQVTTVQKHNATKQKLPQISSDRTTLLCKANLNKNKQTRLSKRIDGDTRASLPDHWKKFEKTTTDNCVSEKNNVCNEIPKELSPIDIINDRIWKSGWNARTQSIGNEANDNDKRSADTEIDVINDRVWRNDRTTGNINKPQMTLIELTNAVNSTTVKDFGQTEVAISPSFSSDSVVISTSNQSSSSSDALHTINDKRLLNNNSKSNCKERSIGPRNCFMRVTPGSKNILLDNVGHYQTVLYTSGTNRPNTALVHVAKSTRSGRSMSTSSEENSPMVATTDNTQLQRVAEWVQSSVSAGKNEQTSKPLDSRDNVSRQKVTQIVEVSKDDTLVKIEMDESTDVQNPLLPLEKMRKLDEIVVEASGDKSLDNPFADASRNVGNTSRHNDAPQDAGLIEDLIIFEPCNTNDNSVENSRVPEDKNDPNYEVKITKEMEEIYLKLAASLDPVSLRLSGPNSADLTIEKYRKDHRRVHVQKLQDKPK
ncbi:uncharacterized protein [Venturia canescens]|uniref:uncharacterized protein n=1 Tax=Venturia canescens TaxID=32260 RepID=UPI001C9C546D|nr:uncharacterized protein LOC122414007 [Venturia canescens]